MSDLSIGDLAEATGVAVGTLRMWETRYGFPQPERHGGGHRRYSPAHVDSVRAVLMHREAGARLEAAIARVTSAQVPPGSVYAEVVRRHPEQQTQRLRKSTLIGLSWAIEDEILAGAQRGHLFGAFQKAENLLSAGRRWADLARVSGSTFALADFTESSSEAADAAGLAASIRRVALPEDSPMHREWAVVFDGPTAAYALTAWEVPGQDAVPDPDRLFESVWTLDPAAVRTAASTCAAVAAGLGDDAAAEVLRGDLAGPSAAHPSAATWSRISHRAVAYVEDVARRRTPGSR